MMPTMLSPSTTGRPPIFLSAMMRAASSSGALGVTVMTGVDMIFSTTRRERR
jgi:hypothetical protein